MDHLDPPFAVDLGIIIVSYNNSDLLRKCLKSIPDACPNLRYAVSVVDNASPDDSVEMVRGEFPKVQLTASNENLGFARANNLQMEMSTAEFVLLLNPDTEPYTGSLALLVDFMRQHPEAGVVGPKLLNTDGSIQLNGRLFPGVWREFLAVSGLRRFNIDGYNRKYQYGRADFDRTCEVDEVSGACLLIRRTAMEKVGVLDPIFFMFYEEIEYCWRVKKGGWKVFYVADALVTHHWMGSVKKSS
ncbi:MAG: glycosyltransferase family 2 protein, partial [Chthonomonadales bacterium]